MHEEQKANGKLDTSMETVKNGLWSEMVCFYRQRLVHFIAGVEKNLSLATGSGTGSMPSTALHAMITRLNDLIIYQKAVPKSHEYGGIIILAYKISVTSRDQRQWQWYEREMAVNTGALRQQLAFLGRLRRCFNTLLSAAELLTGFSSICIVSATKSWELNHREPHQPFQSAITSMGLEFPQTFGKKDQQKTKQRFERLKTADWQVHAEVQVAMTIAEYADNDWVPLKYIGCSRKSCLLCFNFLRFYDDIDTRGCHGKVYDLWNVPENSRLSAKQGANMVGAVVQLETLMKDSLLSDRDWKLELVKESTVGDTILSNITRKFDNFALATAVAHELDRQHEVEFQKKIACNDQPKYERCVLESLEKVKSL